MPEIGHEVAQRIREKGETMESVEAVAQCVDSNRPHPQLTRQGAARTSLTA